MATSGTNTFSVTRDELIEAVLRVLIVVSPGVEPTTEDYNDCSQALNIMIKSWAKKGFPLWVYQTVVVPMVEGITIYPLGPTGGYISGVTITNGGSSYPASGTVSFTGGGGTLAAGTYTATDGVIEEVTITVAGSGYSSAPTVSFSGAGTDATGTALVVGLGMSRPLRVIDAFIRDSNNFDTTLMVISQEEYDQLGDKFSEGVPNQLYYNNLLINGEVTVYNVPADSTSSIYLTVQRMFEDMSTGTDDFDFPQEWYQALKWGLCNELSEEYEQPESKIARIERKAQMYLDECSDWSQEEAGVYFSPDPQGTMRKW